MKMFSRTISLCIVCIFPIFSACSTKCAQPDALVNSNEDINPLKEKISLKYPYFGQLYEAILNKKTILELQNALKDEDELVRASAAEALVVLIGERRMPGMGALPDDRALEELTESLQDNSPIVRSTAALALSKSGDIGATRNALITLSEILKDNNHSWVVHEYSAYCLGQIGDKRSVPVLIAALEGNKTQDFVYPAILRALREIKDPKAVPAIFNVLNANPGNSFICGEGLLALGKIGDDVSVSYLINYLNNPEYRAVCRNYAALGLAQTLSERASSVLKAALKNPKASIRIGAAEALSLYFESEAVTELIRLLDDDNKSVRLKAVVLLGEIGNHKIVPLLKLRLNDEWEEVVNASKKALEKINERENRIVK